MHETWDATLPQFTTHPPFDLFLDLDTIIKQYKKNEWNIWPINKSSSIFTQRDSTLTDDDHNLFLIIYSVKCLVLLLETF